jgi:beta-lactam-binding protein with PASTA domain
VKEGSTVTYQLFTPKTVQVPALVGKQYSDAATALNDIGLKAKQVPDNSPRPAGEVTKQSKEPFDSVPPGTTITLSVSTGKVRLPDVRGKKAADAKTTLNTANWTNVDISKTVDTPNKAKNGLVADENPTPGIAYAQSTPIVLTIYKYVAPAPTCTTPPPTPTDTATATGSPTGTPTGTPSVTPPSTPGALPPCTS